MSSAAYMYKPITLSQCMGHVFVLLKYNDLKMRYRALGLLINRKAYTYTHDGARSTWRLCHYDRTTPWYHLYAHKFRDHSAAAVCIFDNVEYFWSICLWYVNVYADDDFIGRIRKRTYTHDLYWQHHKVINDQKFLTILNLT